MSSLRELTPYKLDKWLASAEFILTRADGRDTLCYEILHAALSELRWHRRFSLNIKQAMEDLAGLVVHRNHTELREAIRGVVEDVSARIQVPDPPPKPKKTPVEFERARLIEKVNNMLRSEGFVLQLHHDSKDPEGQSPQVTFEPVIQ